MATAERQSRRITLWLERAPSTVFTLYGITAAFSTYFCMYAFRKPFSAAKFEGLFFASSEIELKTVLVASQIVGYSLSKFVGIKVCSEVEPGARARALVTLILWAEAALVAFAVVPDSLKLVPIFLNGLALGMVWGMVVGYLEGRRTSELLLVGLSCSFIVASGAVKNVGLALMKGYAVSEAWMPAAVGALSLVPFLASVWFLDQIPPATPEDQAARTIRETMDRVHRWGFMRHFLLGMLLLVTAYLFLTAYRDYRDNFMVELFEELGYSHKEDQSLITRTEMIVAFSVMAVVASVNLIKNNRLGLSAIFAIMLAGFALMGAATAMLDRQAISGRTWITLIGLGAYLVYVPYNSVLFDRLIASTRVVGTAVFAIYVADAVGYSGSVVTLLVKDAGLGGLSKVDFFRGFTYLLSVSGLALIAASALYFLVFKSHGHGRGQQVR
jgi:hypothetical protein